MGDTWVIDILHYLDENGDLSLPRGPARQLAEYIGSIIEAVTSRPTDADVTVTAVQCRCRPKRRRCTSELLAEYDKRDRNTIVWYCPACGYNGSINGWQETLWDKRKFF